jgi:hypothetical protein
MLSIDFNVATKYVFSGLSREFTTNFIYDLIHLPDFNDTTVYLSI